MILSKPPNVIMHTSVIPEKLIEFNSKVDASIAIAEADLTSLQNLLEGKSPTAAQVDILWRALQWPAGGYFFHSLISKLVLG